MRGATRATLLAVVILGVSVVIPLSAGASSGGATHHVTRTTRALRHVPTTMPRLIGLTRAQVYGVMRRHNLYFVTRGPGSSNGKWVDVRAQSPRPGTRVAWHAQASLLVSTFRPRGPRPVPRLEGLNPAQTTAVMRRNALYYTTSGAGGSTGGWTKVIGQSPRPGTKVPWHATVRVDVMTEPTVTSAPVTSAPVTQSAVTAVPLVAGRIKYGDATWYSYVPGDCASAIVPKGTRLYVRDLATGTTIVCTVTDLEGAGLPRVVDLSESQFVELAPLAQGVVRVRVSW